jgi:hypothetical protein
MARANTRKNRSRKAERKDRKTRKAQSGGKRPLSAWNKAVKRVYDEMKRKNSNTTFSSALKEASRRKKAGNL